MRKFVIPLLATVALPNAVFADQTDKGFYLNISPGVIFTKDMKYDSNLGLGGGDVGGDIDIGNGYFGQYGFGYSFGNNYRVEINYTTMQGKIKGIKYNYPAIIASNSYGPLDHFYQSKGFILNLYKDFYKEKRKFNPYLGLGFGPTKIDMGCKGYAQLSTCDMGIESEFRRPYDGFMYQIKAGIGYKLSNKSNLFVETSYVSLSNFDYVGGSSLCKYQKSFGISSGLRFRF